MTMLIEKKQYINKTEFNIYEDVKIDSIIN